MAQRILIVWEDVGFRRELADFLSAQGHTVLTLAPDAEWLGDLLRSAVDVLVTAPETAERRISAILARSGDPPTLLVTVEPGRLLPAVIPQIEHALAERRLHLDIHALRRLVADRIWSGVLAGPSAAAERLRREIAALEALGDPAFLVGPAGSGRRFVARALHLLGPRAGGPLHEIDCEIQPEEAGIRLLFGRDDGPGRRRPGWIERSHGGTLILAGITRLEPGTQFDLARFLETGRVASIPPEGLGARGAPSGAAGTTAGPADGTEVSDREARSSRGPVKAPPPRSTAPQADVRILATLERDPEVEIAQGWLAPVLWKRMRGLVVRVPALAERREDLRELADATLRSLGADGVEITEGAWGWLADRPWRGNLAELEVVLGRALLRRRHRARLERDDFETIAE